MADELRTCQEFDVENEWYLKLTKSELLIISRSVDYYYESLSQLWDIMKNWNGNKTDVPFPLMNYPFTDDVEADHYDDEILKLLDELVNLNLLGKYMNYKNRKDDSYG